MISVLYVDDEPVLLELGKMLLEKSGKIKVDTFLSADIAIKILSPSRYDAIISDYQMPGMDGLAFLSAVRAIQPDLPFIVFTGQGDEGTAIKALNHGADYYLQKGGSPKIQYSEIENYILNIVGREHRKDEILAEKKATEQALSLLQTLYAYAPFGFAYVDTEYVFIHVNDALADIGSKFQTDLLGRTMEDATPGLWMLISPLFEQVATSGMPALNIEVTGETPFGSVTIRNWLVSLYPVLAKDGSMTGYGILLVDITERKQMEEALVRSEDRYRTLAESAEDAIFIINQEGRLAYINSYGAGLFAKNPEELTGLHIDEDGSILTDLIHSDSIREVFAHGKGCSYDAELGSPAFTWMEIRLIPLPDSDPEIHQVLGIARDVTIRKHAENGLLIANNKLNMLSSITRHDIINQLSFLFIDLEDLKDYAAERPESQELIDRVNQAVRTIHRQIVFTREYQEIGIGAPVWQNLHDLIEKSRISLHMGSVQIEEYGCGVEIFADSLFEKVIYNLIENAVRHGGEITMIRCSVIQQPESVLIIEDDGVGIAASDKEKIFSLGFGKNTGFGLFIAREVLSITNMTINETGNPGTGARFEIHIPLGCIRPQQ